MYTKEQHIYNIKRLLKSWEVKFSYNTMKKINKLLIKELSKKYNVSAGAIQSIKLDKSWKFI